VSVASLGQTIPALPVRDAEAAVGFYRDRLGFGVLHHDGGFAVLCRDEAVVHLWQAGDESWRERDSIERPVRSGAESFIAGTASCRIQVQGVHELFEECGRRTSCTPPRPAGWTRQTSAHVSSRHSTRTATS
jgi:catechol 2,3-dioxygenase-like lactoylglutathione lyase family enzyme